MGSIRVVRGGDIPVAPTAASTDRWTRRVLELNDRIAINVVRNEPGAISGWHHHGDHVGCVYVVRGRLRIEWGADGRNVSDVTAGDFYVISANTVHRETNPGPEEQLVVAFVMGEGPRFVEVDRPGSEAGSVRVIRHGEIPAGPSSHGMTRRVSDAGETVSIAEAGNAPGSRSGWHDHAQRTTCVYVVRGQIRVEWGAGGRKSADLAAGDFYVIDPETIHREGNPGSADNLIVGFYLGAGPKVVDVDGPAA